LSARLSPSLPWRAVPLESPDGLASDVDVRSALAFEPEAPSPPDEPAEEPSDELSELDPPSPPAPPEDDSPLDDESLEDRERARLALDRSFLAQPEPLKCTAGVATALRIVPSAPHAGQNLGPSASIRWITSIRFRHDAQT
jgi:hypothetical protein